MLDRARANPWLVVAIAAGAILILAWIGWAIYVTSENGAGAGLGVVIAWPAILAALALISLPFIGGYLLIKRLSEDSGSTATAEAETSEDVDEDDSEEEPEDSAEEEGGEEEEEEEDDEEDDQEEDGADGEEEEEEEDVDDSEEESDDDDDSESDAEARAAKS
jgi:hypothetical protein